ncbi:MAG TPA: YWFCY domain-containing protein [Puia sp.]|jgi:hypothetical protein
MNSKTTSSGADMSGFFIAASVIIVVLDFYYCCYGALIRWDYTSVYTDRIFTVLDQTKLFANLQWERGLVIALILLSLFSANKRKDIVAGYKWPLLITLAGLIFYFGSGWLAPPAGSDATDIARAYMFVTGLGFLMVIGGSGRLATAIASSAHGRFFRKDIGGFPQEEKRIDTKHSLNFRGRYVYNGKKRKSYINIINPRRAVLLIGSPGCGKSRFVIEPAIEQLVGKGMSLFVYDFKFPTLTNYTYNVFRQNLKEYPPGTRFYCINFTDLPLSHRCNLIDPGTLNYFSDAFGISKAILLSMNTTWVRKSGDFFVESAINFVAALIWYLKVYKDGIYCTLPHVIQLSQTPYDQLFTLLNVESSTRAVVNPFIQAYLNKTMEMLDGQIASATIPLTRLISSDIYYVLTGNDLNLEINDPKAPAILCLGGDSVRKQALAPVMSLYIDRLNNCINRPDRRPCALVLDEFGTVRAESVLTTIATARSNDIIPILSVQDLSQLQAQYSDSEASQIMNISGNLICGQVGGDTARWVSERFDSVVEYKTTIAVNSSDTSVSKSEQAVTTVSPAVIATLSSGEFVGIVADDPGKKVERKRFHAEIIKEEGVAMDMEELPVVRKVTEKEVDENFEKVRRDISELVELEMKRILGDPALKGKMVKR